MKKIMMILLVLIFGAALEAKNINIIMNDGTIKQAEFLGQDGKALFIKNAEGKAETVAIKSIGKVFDSDSGEEMKLGSGAAVKEASPAISASTKERVSQHAQDAKKVVAAINEKELEVAPAPEIKIKSDKYEVLDKGEIRKQVNLFARSLPSYIIFDWDEFYIDIMTGGDELRNAYPAMKDYVNFTMGTGFALYVRPFDFAAIGLYTNSEIFFTPAGKDDMYDLPTSAYGAAYRFIIYSEEGGEGTFGGNTDSMFYIEPRIGIRRLGNTFDEAMFGGVAAKGEAMEYSMLLGFIAGDFFNMKLGYHSCLIKDVVTTVGPVDVDLSGFYLAVGVTLH